MRITIELPDDLLRRIKVQAVLTDQKLKVLVPELLETGLSHLDCASPGKPRAKVRLVGADKKAPARHRA